MHFLQMEDPINVVVNIDEAYTKYCIVMLTSLFQNNKDAEFHIHIVAKDLSADAKLELKSFIEEEKGQKVSFYCPDKEKLKDCRVHEDGHISLAAYYRLFLGSILPLDIHKVLYLDCDLIVNGSIITLWETDIKNVSVAAVEDNWSAVSDLYEKLNYPSTYSYFNSGVMLLNLDRLRKNDFEKKALCFISESNYVTYDQDVLNYILHNDKIFLPYRWNIQDAFLRRNRARRNFPESLRKIDAEIPHAVIIHFTGGKKPWLYKSLHPWKECYFQYLDLTRWRGERPRIPLSYKINLLVDKVLNFLRITHPRYLKVPPLKYSI